MIEEVQASPKPIILFIDEAHTLIGAGGAAGQNDAANLLKPALARGTLRTIAATTWAEYKKYFEKDPALTRRFQVIKVEEPDEQKAITMVRGLVPVLEKHHKVQLLDEAVEAAVKLSARYIPARQLPDKAVSLIDTSLRARGHQPARDAAQGGGHQPAHRRAQPGVRHPRPRNRRRAATTSNGRAELTVSLDEEKKRFEELERRLAGREGKSGRHPRAARPDPRPPRRQQDQRRDHRRQDERHGDRDGHGRHGDRAP